MVRLTWKLVGFGARFLQVVLWHFSDSSEVLITKVHLWYCLLWWFFFQLEVAKEFGPLVDCLAKIFLQSLAAILFAGMPRREKSQIGRCFAVFAIVSQETFIRHGLMFMSNYLCIFYLSVCLSDCLFVCALYLLTYMLSIYYIIYNAYTYIDMYMYMYVHAWWLFASAWRGLNL